MKPAAACVTGRRCTTAVLEEAETQQKNRAMTSGNTVESRTGCWIFFFFSKNEGAEEHFGFLIRPDRSVNANGHVSQQQHATHSRSARHVGVDPADAAHSKPSVRRQHFPRFPANEQINKSHSRPVKGETSYLVLRRGRG